MDFPDTPTAGTPYSYDTVQWTFNGIGWEKQRGGKSVMSIVGNRTITVLPSTAISGLVSFDTT